MQKPVIQNTLHAYFKTPVQNREAAESIKLCYLTQKLKIQTLPTIMQKTVEVSKQYLLKLKILILLNNN